jgi:hypothetical protein
MLRLGSCGVTNTDTDLICAIGHALYDSVPDGGNPNNSPFCGRKITAYSGNDPRHLSKLEADVQLRWQQCDSYCCG